MYLKNFPCIKYLKLYEPHGPLALFFRWSAENVGSDFYQMFIRFSKTKKTKSHELTRLLGLKQFWDEEQRI